MSEEQEPDLITKLDLQFDVFEAFEEAQRQAYAAVLSNMLYQNIVAEVFAINPEVYREAQKRTHEKYGERYAGIIKKYENKDRS